MILQNFKTLLLFVALFLISSAQPASSAPLDMLESLPENVLDFPSEPKDIQLLGRTYQYQTLPHKTFKEDVAIDYVPFVARKNSDGTLQAITDPTEMKAVLAYIYCGWQNMYWNAAKLRLYADILEQAADESDPSQANAAIVCLDTSGFLFKLGISALFSPNLTLTISSLNNLAGIGFVLSLGDFMLNTVNDILDVNPNTFELTQAMQALSIFSPSGLEELNPSKFGLLSDYFSKECSALINEIELTQNELKILAFLFDDNEDLTGSIEQIGHSVQDIIADPLNYPEAIRAMPWHSKHKILLNTRNIFLEKAAEYAVSSALGPLLDYGSEFQMILAMLQIHYNTAAMLARVAADKMDNATAATDPEELLNHISGVTGSISAIDAMNRVLYEGSAVLYRRLCRLDNEAWQSFFVISDQDLQNASGFMTTTWERYHDHLSRIENFSQAMDLLYDYYGVPDQGQIIPPSITVTAPGGEALEVGDLVTIRWTTTNLNNNVDVHLTIDGGASWTLLACIPASMGTFTWTVPSSLGSECYIRVRSSLNEAISGTSAPFVIREQCATHNLAIYQSELTKSVLDYSGSTALQVYTRNLLSSSDTVNVTLSVSGPGYQWSKLLHSFTLAGNTSDSLGCSLIWSPGSDEWPSVTADGYYTLTATVESVGGCDKDYSDNSRSFSVYVTRDGTPPTHKAFKINMYEISEGEIRTINNHEFEFSSYNSVDGEAKLYVDGDRFYLTKDEGRFTDDLQVVFWWHRIVHSIPAVMHLFMGTADDNKALSPYQLSVTRGETAVFSDPVGYDDSHTYVVVGSDSKPNFDASVESELNFNDSGNSISVGTAAESVGTHRFAILTDIPISSSDTQYLAFGRLDIIAPKYLVNIETDGTGSGTISINGSTISLPHSLIYDEGSSLTLTASPSAGSKFTGWTGNVTSSSATITVTASQALNLTASFSREAKLALSKVGSGTVAINGQLVTLPYEGTFEYGQTVTLVAIPESGYTFAGWQGTNNLVADATAQIQMVSNENYQACFSPLYRLTVNTQGTGSILVNGVARTDGEVVEISSEETVSLAAQPAEGYLFSGWSGILAGSSANTFFTVSSDVAVSAIFSAKRPALNLIASPSVGGQVSASPAPGSDGLYSWGQIVTISATPFEGYMFDNWSGAASGNSTQIQVTLDDDAVASAQFIAFATDTDGDGVPDTEDVFPNDETEWEDTDKDGIGNNADLDDDGDDIPDAWEIQHNLNPLDPSDANADPDKDGYSNLQEYINKTDPHQITTDHIFIPNIINLLLNYYSKP